MLIIWLIIWLIFTEYDWFMLIIYAPCYAGYADYSGFVLLFAQKQVLPSQYNKDKYDKEFLQHEGEQIVVFW